MTSDLQKSLSCCQSKNPPRLDVLQFAMTHEKNGPKKKGISTASTEEGCGASYPKAPHDSMLYTQTPQAC